MNMNLKEKLISLDVDIKEKKDIIDEVKKYLADHNEPVVKITSKLSNDAEKLVEEYVVKVKGIKKQKSVSRPKTLKANDDKKVEVENTATNVSVQDFAPNNGTNDKSVENKKISSKPIINTANSKVISKDFNDSSKQKMSSPNGRPISQEVIDEFNNRMKAEREQLENANDGVADKNEAQNVAVDGGTTNVNVNTDINTNVNTNVNTNGISFVSSVETNLTQNVESKCDNSNVASKIETIKDTNETKDINETKDTNETNQTKQTQNDIKDVDKNADNKKFVDFELGQSNANKGITYIGNNSASLNNKNAANRNDGQHNNQNNKNMNNQHNGNNQNRQNNNQNRQNNNQNRQNNNQNRQGNNQNRQNNQNNKNNNGKNGQRFNQNGSNTKNNNQNNNSGNRYGANNKKDDFRNRQNQNGNNNRNRNQGQKNPNQGGRVSFNPNNASIAIGTTNRFDGKQHDKEKFNRDFENKGNKNKGLKNNNKQDKYKINAQNYDVQKDKVKGPKKNGPGAFIKPEVKKEDDIKIKSITIPESITIKDLAAKLKIQPAAIVKELFMSGKMVTPNTELTYEEAENIAIEKDILCEKEKKVDVIAELLKEQEDDEKDMVLRPPVVCVMGHVDHGKTSILDAIRKTNVMAHEAGGITQHIGAYQVKAKDRLITFLDTPGHEAFTAMRLRGAKSTDIAILVVAADDGVKPQTIEAINHAKAANVEIIVAINKIDKPEANIDRVKQQLSEYELVPSDWGGSTTYCEVSAKKNIGIDDLLETIILTADVLDLKANPNRRARGIVIEGLLDKGKGPVARILVQKGTLHIGDYVAMGQSFGKIRAMIDHTGNRIKEALPSTPIEILGLSNVPMSGDTFICFDNEKDARAFAETFIAESKKELVKESKQKVTLDALFDKIKAGELKELDIVLKADVVGSLEALKTSLVKLSNDEIVVKIIHEGVGNVNESDVTLASASNAIIIAFNVKVEQNAKSIAEKENVDLRSYDIIYNAVDDVERAMKGMLAPIYEEKVIGQLVVRQVFKSSNVGNIAGAYVTDGEIRRNAKVRVKRGDEQIFDGDVLSLKRFKDEAKEVKMGNECGVVLADFSDFAVDDTMEVYVVEEKKVE